MRNFIKRSALLIFASLFIWTGYWSAIAYAIEHVISLANENSQISRPKIQFELASVTGYPQNFSIGITEVEMGNKDSFTWATEEIILKAKSYQPNRVSLDLSEPHSVSGSIGAFEIDSEIADLSVLLKPNLQLSLGSIEGFFKILKFSIAERLSAEIETVSFRVDAFPGTEKSYKVIAEMDNLDLSEMLVSLPSDYQMIQNFSIAAEVELTRPLDRRSIGTGFPQLKMLFLHEALINYGATSISLDARLVNKPTDNLDGTINVTIQQWKALFNLAKQLGYVQPNIEEFIYTTLTNLANQDGTEDTLTIPLSVNNNTISYGALTLGVLH
tara:strand:+ start:3104 stop:4087 length:984 start_codon:yes stop_codon:yes gene_type:complete